MIFSTFLTLYNRCNKRLRLSFV